MAGGMLLLQLLIVCVSWISVQAIYCGDANCYDLLGVPETASPVEIKKAYYKLSLIHHPDKSLDPESKKAFVNIANAYEILKDDDRRKQYDYALAHPEEFFYNTARYYHAYYGHKADLRLVFVGLLVVFSIFQYGNQWTSYKQTMELVKQTTAYKNKLNAFVAEKNGGIGNNKKKNIRARRDDYSKEFGDAFDFEIQGVVRPTIRGLIGVQFLFLPYTLGKLAYWYASWTWRYKFKKQPLTQEDSEYLTRKALRMDEAMWNSMDIETREDLVKRHLWIPENLEVYTNDLKRDSKRRR